MEYTDEWEEEQLVLVELSGLLEQEVLFKASANHCRLLGVNTSEPVLQIGHYTFVGHYEDVVGTHVLFEESSSYDTATKQFNYKGSTSKCLKMGRAFLRDKTSEENVLEDSDSSSGNSSSDDDDNDDNDDNNKTKKDHNENGKTTADDPDIQYNDNVPGHTI